MFLILAGHIPSVCSGTSTSFLNVNPWSGVTLGSVSSLDVLSISFLSTLAHTVHSAPNLFSWDS